ncbi:MAG: hypothetical protein LUE63_04965 [Lachnospiraceae bacterium]|nr:hypothetical protein [Lachnospiraceae bacterium]
MEPLLYARQRAKTWFVAHEVYLLPVIKFLLMMIILLVMNWHLGYRYVMMRWVLVILASLVSCLLPWSGMTAVAALYLLGHVSALSWEGAVVLGAMMFIAMMLHYLFLPGGSFLIVLVCLASYLKVPFLVPLLAGIFGSALSFLPVGIGVMIYYTMLSLEQNATYLLDAGNGISDCFLQILGTLQGDSKMILTLLVLCLTALIVYGLSHLAVDYARLIAVGTGGILILLLFILGGFLFNVSVSYMNVLGGCVFCSALAAAASFWGDIVDFSRPEYLQYEDDEYIYYVKAFPKVGLVEPERKVKEINSRREGRSGRREAH